MLEFHENFSLFSTVCYEGLLSIWRNCAYVLHCWVAMIQFLCNREDFGEIRNWKIRSLLFAVCGSRTNKNKANSSSQRERKELNFFHRKTRTLSSIIQLVYLILQPFAIINKFETNFMQMHAAAINKDRWNFRQNNKNNIICVRISDILRVQFFHYSIRDLGWNAKDGLNACVRFVLGYIFNLITLFLNHQQQISQRKTSLISTTNEKKKSTRSQQPKKYENTKYWSEFVHFWFLFSIHTFRVSSLFLFHFCFSRTFCIMIFWNEIAWELNQVPHFQKPISNTFANRSQWNFSDWLNQPIKCKLFVERLFY